MMHLPSNRGQTWFKIFDAYGQAIDGSKEQWILPFRQKPGKIMDFSKQNARWLQGQQWKRLSHVKGTWLVSNPRMLCTNPKPTRIFVAKLLSPATHEKLGVIWVNQVRLIREATNLDLRRFGIYRAFKPNF